VVRTIFLLDWISSRELRQEVTASTNKIEFYNGFVPTSGRFSADRRAPQ
jgi:TnpA family transposase